MIYKVGIVGYGVVGKKRHGVLNKISDFDVVAVSDKSFDDQTKLTSVTCYLDYKDLIKEQKSKETFSNLASLMKSFKIGQDQSEDLIFFVEDDYLHFEAMLEEMVASYERMASQLNKDIFICPSDYPYLYMSNEKTNILIGNKRHWRTVNKTLCTFMTSKYLLNKYWENFEKTCLDRNEPFEKYINEIYEKEICLSPLKSLSLHMTNINSSYGLAPFIDYKKLWDENK